MSLTYLPVFHRLFGSAPIRADHWLAIIACALAASLVVALEKWLRYRSTHLAG